MYPNLYYAFKDLFGVEWSFLRFINSFGFFVALGFLAGALILTKELKRKEREGLLHGKDVKITVGRPATATELFLNFMLGFILGFKLIGLFFLGSSDTADPQEFIFSTQGNWPAGILLGALFAGLKWREKNKERLPEPEERTIRIWPHDRVGDLVILAALFGFLGAKIFHNLENWNEFVSDPVESLLSFSGLTFYGGLICATAAILYYARKHRIRFRHLCDAAAPGLLVAYAIGRIGCQVSGDGDWGILNSAYVTTADSKLIPVNEQQFKQALQTHSSLYISQFKVNNIDSVPHKSVKAPGGLPTWTVAYQYPHNVINEGVPIKDCEGEYCNHLPIPVFPTSLYETLTCFILFVVLWAFRTKIRVPGHMFAIYLIVVALERFFIEKIRVNSKYDIFGLHPTQAELISLALLILGISLLFVFQRWKLNNKH